MISQNKIINEKYFAENPQIKTALHLLDKIAILWLHTFFRDIIFILIFCEAYFGFQQYVQKLKRLLKFH